MEFPTDRCATGVGIAFEYRDFQTGFGEIGAISETIVARPNDDRIILVHCTLR